MFILCPISRLDMMSLPLTSSRLRTSLLREHACLATIPYYTHTRLSIWKNDEQISEIHLGNYRKPDYHITISNITLFFISKYLQARNILQCLLDLVGKVTMSVSLSKIYFAKLFGIDIFEYKPWLLVRVNRTACDILRFSKLISFKL